MQPITYTLDTNDLHVLAVIAWDGQRGALLVSYDERCLSIKLGPQVEYLREDACRALTSRRSLAEMAPQFTYSHKATCRALANRLDLLVEQGKVLESEARCLLDSIATRFNGLRTEHDFDRFVGVCALDVERCRRNDEDFEKVVAPALAEAIKSDIKAGPRVTAETALAAMTSALKGFLQSQGFPVKAGDGLKDVLTGLGAAVSSLRAQADASLQAGSCDAILTKALERRGVAVPVSFGPALKVRALVEYLGAVEAAVVKWQAVGRRWQKFADGRLRLGWPCPRMLSLQHIEVPPGATKIEKADLERLQAEVRGYVLPTQVTHTTPFEVDEAFLKRWDAYKRLASCAPGECTDVESYSTSGAPTEVPLVVHKHDSEEPTC